jgi:hypothetical protein
VRNTYTAKTTLSEILKKANGVKHVFCKYMQYNLEPTACKTAWTQPAGLSNAISIDLRFLPNSAKLPQLSGRFYVFGINLKSHRFYVKGAAPRNSNTRAKVNGKRISESRIKGARDLALH